MTTEQYHDGHGRITVAVVDSSSAPPARRSLPSRYIWVWTGIWLFYLAQPAVAAWHLPVLWHRVVALAGLVVFAVLFLSGFMLARDRLRVGQTLDRARALSVLVAAAAVLGLVTALLGQGGLALFVYIGVMAVYLLPGRAGPAVVLGLIVGTFVLQHTVPGWHTDGQIQFSIFISGLAMWGVMRLVQRNGELAAAREEITRLAVEDERNRFARDLHDILGHSLTVVAVKAELAGRLVHLDPDRAEREIGDVERLSREALHDVRTALSGHRDVSLIGELANARSALAAAGIQAELPHALDDVPADRRELFGWVLREGVTNVVRHSGASRCRVQVTADEIRITDDGRGPLNGSTVDGTREGVGLVGLRERVKGAGATLRVGRAAEGGFELRVSV